MQSTVSLAAGWRGDGHLVSRRGAWLVFAMTFPLMVFDFVDRQIVVAMFPFVYPTGITGYLVVSAD